MLNQNKMTELHQKIAADLGDIPFRVPIVADPTRGELEKKFGAGKISYTFRIVYRSLERTLTNSEVNDLHEEIRQRTEKEFKAILR